MRRLVLALLGAALVLTGWLVATRPVGDERLRARFDSVGEGTVTRVETLSDVYTRLTVAWVDRKGARHSSRFDTDVYPWAVGDPFDVVYDGAHPERQARPADPENTSNGSLRVAARVEGCGAAALGLLLALGPLVVGWRRRYQLVRARSSAEVLSWAQLELPSGPPFAWDDHGVRERWRRYGRWGPRLLAAGCALSLVAVAFFLVLEREDTGLLRDGVRVEGTVVKGGDFGGRGTQSYVEVRYVDAQDKVHVSALHGPTPDDLRPGDVVVVFYARHRPADFRTEGYTNHSNVVDNLPIWLVVGPGLLLLFAAGVEVTVVGGRRVMRHHAWVDATLLESDRGRTIDVPYLDLELHLPGSPGLRTRLGAGSKNAVSGFAATVRKGQVVRVCPGRGRRFLIDAEGLDRPCVALLPRSVRQARRWAKVAR